MKARREAIVRVAPSFDLTVMRGTAAHCAEERLARGHVTGRAQVIGGRWRSHYIRKLTSTRKSTGVGSPSRTVGSYFLSETALSAAWISKGCPLTTFSWITPPCSSMTASITTVPWTCAWDAKVG